MTPKTEHEKSLIQQAIDDPIAFQSLYELYFNRVYCYVETRINSPQDSEDILSDIFLQIWTGLRQLKDRHMFSFDAWVFTIARNRIIDFYRRQERISVDLSTDTFQEQYVTCHDPDTLFMEQGRNAEMRAILNQIPERRREVLILKYFGGLRNLEIAEVLSVDERTIASHLTRGLKDLKRMMVESLN